MTINEFMTKDHRVCDEVFVKSENLVQRQEWDKALEEFTKFQKQMLEHFKMEEEVMFEEFNKNATSGCNPTPVMVMEHNQMRELMQMMQNALSQKDNEKFLGLSENLLFVMGQHNMKEEQMMYNLADGVLDAKQTIEKMQEVVNG